MESGEGSGEDGVGGWRVGRKCGVVGGGKRTWCGGEEVWVGREHGVVGGEERSWGGNVVGWEVRRDHGEGMWCGVVETCSGCSYTTLSPPGYRCMKIQSGVKQRLCPCWLAIKFIL